MRFLGRLAMVLGLVGVIVAAVIGCWPLHSAGVSGSALRPHYSEYFEFAVAGPLPAHPRTDDFRRAGVVFPQDVVRDRRVLVLETFATAVLLLVAGAAAQRSGSRRFRSPPSRV